MVTLHSAAPLNAFWQRLMPILGALGMTLVLIGALPVAAHADALAQVNRTTVADGGTLTLRVRTRDTNHDIDLAPLLRDFEVESQGHSTNNPALTGLGTEFLEWEIVLTPRRTGDLVIPSLSVGDAQTQPIEIRVLSVSPEQRAIMDRDVFLEVNIDSTSLYVGEPALVNLTLYYNVNVNGTFADINPGNSEWKPLGDGITGTVEQEGSAYNFTRFKYLYTPLSEGPRELPAFAFEGDYRTNRLSPRMPLTDVHSDPVPLEVKPIPDDFPDGYPWLPARDLVLEQQWSSEATAYQAGDQINRELRIRARGPAAANLPAVLDNLPTDEGINQYPNPAQTSDQVQDNDRVAERTESIAYLLVAGGEHTLPAVRLPWWDLDSDALRWAEASGRTFSVAGALVPVDLPAPADRAAGPPAQAADVHWQRWALIAGLLLLLVVTGWWLGRRLPQRLRPMAQWLWFIVALPVRLLWRLVSGLVRRLIWPWAAPVMRLPSRLLSTLIARLPRWSARSEPPPGPRNSASPGPKSAQQAPPQPGRSGKGAARQWKPAAVQAARDHDWATLLNELEQQLTAYGWPDTQSVESAFGITGLTPLVRQTQRCLYGPPGQADDAQQLSVQWQELLAQWPQAPGSARRRSDAPGLYPDRD